MSHRGDSPGMQWVSESGQVMLACVRLAVQDRSAAGAQPMASPDGGTVLVSNGEVYGSRGRVAGPWPSRTHCDTEFVLQQVASTTDVADMLRGLDGMFALAWHDTREGRTVLARDHFGVKPLVYSVVDDGLLFASEAEALLASGLVAADVDTTEFVLRSWVRMDAADERTWLKNVRCLQPAEYLEVDPPRIRLHRYWQPEPDDTPVGAEEIRAAFDRAVDQRCRADVPRAAVLSGGVDSSAAFAALRKRDIEVAPYVLQYRDGIGGSADDVAHARLVAAEHGVDLTVCELSQHAAVDLVPEVTSRLMRPLLHGAELAMYQLYQRISAQGQVVVYSGHGADEMWGYQDGGYFPIVDPAARVEIHGRHYLTHRLYPDERPLWGRLLRWMARELDVDMDDVHEQVWDRVLREYRAPAGAEPLKRGRHHLMRRFLVYVNDMVDATSSAHTLEDRPVFQDVTLAELAFRSPEYLKSSWTPGSHKDLLKKALADLLPQPVIDRRKQGFPAPVDTAYRDALRSLLADSGMPFDLPAVPRELRSELNTSELMFLASSSVWLAGPRLVRPGRPKRSDPSVFAR
ncbi:asparagine synthetase B family protein [Streptomyces sp. Je 1-369]|uniref:asparagine synthetase B family protein n=1 Tax=Streptomyces sp. Je 1-369 TaxID=2966192 RepID=UPI0022867977|nr:asparagine synthetase B [Streptomyces sp. Je 1-369]WAL96812.1 asparagine synthetase B [Streptomyces sp. Je 1-369]